jgi:hypothetical protein
MAQVLRKPTFRNTPIASLRGARLIRLGAGVLGVALRTGIHLAGSSLMVAGAICQATAAWQYAGGSALDGHGWTVNLEAGKP